MLEGEVAKQFMDVIGGLKSEARALAHGGGDAEQQRGVRTLAYRQNFR
jgi:hypothetical protein